MRSRNWHWYFYRVLDLLWHGAAIRLLRPRGLVVAPGYPFRGRPIISLASGSRIEIGGSCRLVSRSAETALGVNHRMVLRTLRASARICIGDGVRASGVTICAAKQVTIGNRVVIGANATIADTDFHSLDPDVRSSPQDASDAASLEVSIGDDVFIGGSAIILKGISIGRAAVVGAGSVVTGDVPPNCVVAGNPAKRVGSIQDRSGDTRSRQNHELPTVRL